MSIRFPLLSVWGLLLLLCSCANQEVYNQRSGPPASVQISVNDRWSEDKSLALTSTVANFELEVGCDDGYTQPVTSSEFSLPLRNTNCVGKLVSFSRDGQNTYHAKAGLDFTTWQPADRAVFTCSEGSTCAGQPDLVVYVMDQLPAPNLTVFSQIRYKFAENTMGADVQSQHSDLSFNRVIVGDEPPPFTLRAAYEGVIANQLEVLAECDTFQIGSTFADAICGTTSLGGLRIAITPYPEGAVTTDVLAELAATHSTLLPERTAFLVEHGQWGIGRGGFSATVTTSSAEQYLLILSMAGSDSYTFHRLLQRDAPTYTIGRQISGLQVDESVSLSLNGIEQTFRTNGDLLFEYRLLDLKPYEVTTLNNDATCAVAGGTGVVSGADVTSIQVTCMSYRSVGESKGSRAIWADHDGVISAT